MNQLLQQKELRPFLAEALNPETPSYRLKLLASHGVVPFLVEIGNPCLGADLN